MDEAAKLRYSDRDISVFVGALMEKLGLSEVVLEEVDLVAATGKTISVYRNTETFSYKITVS